jgi:hypothetical protein
MNAQQLAEIRIEKLISRLPKWIGKAIRWIRRPAMRWVRIPVALLLIVGGFLSFLPILGLWMLPLAMILLAEDIPLLRRAVDRSVNWLAAKRPHWFR